MAIAHDADSSKTDDGTVTGGTETWTHVCTGSNLLLVVEIALWQDVAGTGNVSGVTYNGVALTQAGTGITSTGMRAEIWYLVAPATGSHSVIATVSGTTDSRRFGSSSFTGVIQTSPVDATTSNSTTTGAPSKAITTVTANALVIDTVSRFSSDAMTVSAGQTQIYNDISFPNGQTWATTRGAASWKLATTAGSYTMSWTGSSANDTAQMLAAFKPAVGAANNGAGFLMALL